MYWIYLSPHLDDAVYSCGGLIHQQVLRGSRVEIWTLFAGQPGQGDVSDFARQLHARWDSGPDPVTLRREEDAEACGLIGANPRHFGYLDCIYRRDPQSGKYMYQSDQDLFGGIHSGDQKLLDQLVSTLLEEIPDNCAVAAPLGIGNHVDHSLVRKAASRLNREVVYYPEYPYLRDPDGRSTLDYLDHSPEWEADCYSLSKISVLSWIAAAAAYRSQLSSFWIDREQMEVEIQKMIKEGGVGTLWKTLEEA
jgi:LmbE family N-acetylglucosaminyl deacetylase